MGSELSRHEIESLKRANFCNSIIVQWKNYPRQKVTLSDQSKRVTRLMDSKSEQWKILDNSSNPDNYMFQCLEQKLRASGKRQIMCDFWSRRESKLHSNVIKLKTTKWEKKVPSLIARPVEGGRGMRGRLYIRIEKKMIFIIVLLFGNNLQYKFNI